MSDVLVKRSSITVRSPAGVAYLRLRLDADPRYKLVPFAFIFMPAGIDLVFLTDEGPPASDLFPLPLACEKSTLMISSIDHYGVGQEAVCLRLE